MTDQPSPEELLAAAGGPRPLPPALRARLELSMAAGRQPGRGPAATAIEPGSSDGVRRTLPPEVRGRLETTLKPPLRRPVWGRLAAAAAAAAVVVAVGAVVQGALRPAGHGAGIAAGRTETHGQNGHALEATPPPGPRAGSSKKVGAVFARRSPGAKAAPSRSSPSAATSSHPPAPAAAAPPPPRVASVSPSRGPAAGGNSVLVSGSGLAGATSVLFGSAPAPRIQSVTSTSLRVTAPSHVPGRVNVVVVTPEGRSARSSGASYAYLGPGAGAPPKH